MREDGDLRARIEARVAARRQATGRPSPGLNGRTPAPSSGDGGESPAPAAPAQRADDDQAAPPADTPADDDRAASPADDDRAASPADGEAAPPAATGAPDTGATPERPRPGPGRRPRPPGPQPSPTVHDDTAEQDAPRSPDISRFLAASEPQADEEPREPSAAAKNTRKVVRILLRIALIVGIAVGAALLLRTYVVAPYYIPSESMEPTLHGCSGCDDDHVLVDKISYRLHDPHQSDIVVFTRPPGAPTTDHVLIKRVIGLPGDRVALEHGNVYINGKRLKEPYVRKACGPHPTQPETGRSRWQVPKGDLFVLGDNRCNSMDSRVFGPIAESSVIGRAFAIIWPLGRIGLL